MACPSMVPREKVAQWLCVFSLLLIGVMVMRRTVFQWLKTPLKREESWTVAISEALGVKIKFDNSAVY